MKQKPNSSSAPSAITFAENIDDTNFLQYLIIDVRAENIDDTNFLQYLIIDVRAENIDKQ
jgi:hypothetical protein